MGLFGDETSILSGCGTVLRTMRSVTQHLEEQIKCQIDICNNIHY